MPFFWQVGRPLRVDKVSIFKKLRLQDGIYSISTNDFHEITPVINSKILNLYQRFNRTTKEIGLKPHCMFLGWKKKVLQYFGRMRYNSAATDAFASVVKMTNYTGLRCRVHLILSECYSPDLPKSWRWRPTVDWEMSSSPDTLRVLLAGFAEVVKVITHSGLGDAELAWYSPSATHWIFLYGFRLVYLTLPNRRRLYNLREISSAIWLLHCDQLHLSPPPLASASRLHLSPPPLASTSRLICSFSRLMASFKRVKHNFPNLTSWHVCASAFKSHTW